MALTELDISKQKAIEEAGLTAMPELLTKDKKIIWLKAIVLVKKINGITNYALADSDGGPDIYLKKDFGRPAAILEIAEIYPYEFFESRYLPKFYKDSDIINYLIKNENIDVSLLLDDTGKTEYQIHADRARVKKMIMDSAIKLAKLLKDEDVKYRKILNQNGKEKDGDNIRQNKRGRKPNSSKQ
jgi:hypothetical protein